jgi:BirA family transcriptional regulator, biotin operon repressor / biotin---[acetyl-CoA-carboxylase] ligase
LAEIEIEEGTVVISDHQSAGRGRLGRSWVSEAGKNLLFSIILRPHIEQERIGLLSFFTAVGVAKGIESVIQNRMEFKWPNDILLNKKKCCGILLESSLISDKLNYAVIGIGINVNQQKFHKDLAHHATSLRNETRTIIERKELFHAILRSLDILYVQVHRGKFDLVLKEWLARTSFIGKKISLMHDNEIIRGTVHSINHAGALVLKTQKGLQTFYAGDVTLHGLGNG